MTDPRIHMTRGCLDFIDRHSSEEAVDHGVEVLGWLLGFFKGGQVYAVEALPCTRYRYQDRFGAQAEPAHEADIANAYPRKIGMVGIYHSHPFHGSEDATFHSHVDDNTLEQRGRGRGNYISLVTDGQHRYSCYVMGRRGRRKVDPSIVTEIPLDVYLQRYSCEAAFRVVRDVPEQNTVSLFPTILSAITERVEESFAAATVEKRAVVLPQTGDGNGENTLIVRPRSKGVEVALDITVRTAIYLPSKETPREIIQCATNEVSDEVSLLLRRAMESLGAYEAGSGELTLNLGTIQMDVSGPLPKKVYHPPERYAVLRRA